MRLGPCGPCMQYYIATLLGLAKSIEIEFLTELKEWIFAGVVLLGCCGVWIWGGPDCQVTSFFLC
jgi:predicted Na+-dependent transporter